MTGLTTYDAVRSDLQTVVTNVESSSLPSEPISSVACYRTHILTPAELAIIRDESRVLTS